MKRWQVKTVVVRKFKSGAFEGQYKPFVLPEGSVPLTASAVFESLVVYYAVPA